MNKINELQLIVEEKNFGSLKTNAENIKNEVNKMIDDFDLEYYTENNVDETKKAKATLNKMSKALNDERILLEKEFNKPFEEFKLIVNDTVSMIKSLSTKLDETVKIVEKKTKAKRMDVINSIYLANIGDLKEVLPLDRVFVPQWLNKGSFDSNNEFKCKDELILKLDKIRTDLLAITELKSKYEVSLKNEYLKTFNLGLIIVKNKELIESEEKLAIQEVESYEYIEKQKEKIQKEKMEENAKIKIINIEDEIKTYTLKITGTLSQLKGLKEFMELNKMEYERVGN